MASTAPPHPIPLRKHKATNQAYVILDGKRKYLGRHDRPETLERYHRTIAEFQASEVLAEHASAITVAELLVHYLEHCETYYRRADGTPSPGMEGAILAVRPLKKLYGNTAAAQFGPRALRTIREGWIVDGLCRTTINKRVGVIKRLFKFGVEHELIPAAVHQALDCLANLHKGRSKAKESRKVTPVLQAHIDAIQPHVSRPVWGLVRIQLLTGARSGEIVKLRRVDLDTSGAIWTARLLEHKTAHADRERTLYFGAKAQAVLREYFPGKGPVEYLFSPQDAEQDCRARRHAARKTPKHRGNAPGTNVKDAPAVKPGEHYTPASYRKAITRACKAAGVPVWHPHQLRHTAGTNIRKEMGLEAAQVWLGHAQANVTQVYAEVDRARALQIAERMG